MAVQPAQEPCRQARSFAEVLSKDPKASAALHPLPQRRTLHHLPHSVVRKERGITRLVQTPTPRDGVWEAGGRHSVYQGPTALPRYPVPAYAEHDGSGCATVTQQLNRLASRDNDPFNVRPGGQGTCNGSDHCPAFFSAKSTRTEVLRPSTLLTRANRSSVGWRAPFFVVVDRLF